MVGNHIVLHYLCYGRAPLTGFLSFKWDTPRSARLLSIPVPEQGAPLGILLVGSRQLRCARKYLCLCCAQGKQQFEPPMQPTSIWPT